MMKKLLRRLTNSNDGSSMLELALLLPVILLMMVGAMDFGSAFTRKMEMANAVKAGIHYALVRKPIEGDLSEIIATVNTNLGTSGNATTAVSVNRYCKCDGVLQACATSCGETGYQSAYVTIGITENYQTPFFNYSWVMASFPIAEESTIQLK